MPLFGSRVVCKYGNYKYIEERDKKFAEREENLGEWVREKSIRKAALKTLRRRNQLMSEGTLEAGSEEGEEDTEQRKQVTFSEEGRVVEVPGAKIEEERTNQGLTDLGPTRVTLSEQRSCSIL